MMEFSDLTRLAGGHAEARIIQVAVELGIFDAIAAGATDLSSIASRLATDHRATKLLLNALVAVGLLHKNADRFALAPVPAKHLVQSSPKYLGGMIQFDASLWSSWGKLAEAVRTGTPARTPNRYQGDVSETELFIAAMDSLVNARGDAEVVSMALDWSGVSELLDVGSGPATYPIALCKRYPELHAAIFDLPGTLAATQRYVGQAGMANRIRLIAGDYRTDPIPGRYGVVFLSNIVHGEGEQDNSALIRKLSANLQPGGRLVIKDHVLDDSGTSPPVGAVFSLLMLLTTESGRCYSFSEIKLWMEEAGLSRVQQLDLPPPLTSSLVIGTKS